MGDGPGYLTVWLCSKPGLSPCGSKGLGIMSAPPESPKALRTPLSSTAGFPAGLGDIAFDGNQLLGHALKRIQRDFQKVWVVRQ